MIDNGEGLSAGEPSKEEDPVTKDTKDKLVGVLDRVALDSKPVFPPELAEITGDPRYIALTGEEKGVPIDIDVANFPRGNLDKPNLRWVAVLERETSPGLLEEYLFSEIPDGWDVEYHERMHTLSDQEAIEEAMEEESPDNLKEIYQQRERSIQQTRELHMAGVSEKKAQRLKRILETSKSKS